MSKKIIANYEMIIGYKNYPTNFGLALSEFIDNSIGSYQYNDESKPIDGCLIEIIFDNRDLNNKKVIIIDNANGIDPIEMEKAIQPNDRTDKNDTSYNQYGVGMKLGAFWYGSDLTIYSKKRDNVEYMLELLTSQKNPTDEVVVESIISKNNKVPYSSGTIIEISHVHSDRDLVSKKDGINYIKSFLGWRYNKLLDKGLKIILYVKTNDYKKNQKIDIDSYVNKPFKVEELFDVKNKNLSKQRREEFNRRIFKLREELSSNNKLTKEMEEVFKKLDSEEDFTFKKELNINGKKAILNYAIISSTTSYMNKYQGVTIYHKDRAIRHGPNDVGNDIGSNSTIPFVEISSGSGNKARYRWLYGDINLTGIENPDQNKRDFSWSANGKEELQSQLEEIFNNLEKFLEIISSVNDKKENNLPNDKDANKIGNGICEKFPNLSSTNVISTSKNINGENVICINDINIHDDIYKIKICESKSINKFLDVEFDDSTNTFTITIQAENKLWKPLINNIEFKTELLYPIALILGVAQWSYNNPEGAKKFDKIQSKEFIDIIDVLIKQWG